MYAVIETGSKQYKVGLGHRLKIEKLAVKEGESVAIHRVLMVVDGDQVTFGGNAYDKPVKVKVLGHGRGKKIRVFKKKRRKGYRRTQGHRQDFTEIEIVGIGDQVLQPYEAVEESVQEVQQIEAGEQDSADSQETMEESANENMSEKAEDTAKTE